MSRTDGGGIGVDGGPPFDSGPRAEITGVRIEPASALLESIDGSMPEQTFAAVAIYSDGTEGPARGPLFAIDVLAIGDIDPASGRFVANGLVGGAATVRVEVPSPAGGSPLSATATVEVTLRRTLYGGGTTPDTATRFAGPLSGDPGGAAEIVYPLANAVMPQNVYPADIQWLRGNAGDVFRITLSKPHANVVAYVAHSGAGFGNHWLVDIAAWRALAQSDGDAPMTISVDRYDGTGGTAYSSPPVVMRFARAALTGSVYYWDIAAGRIIRIDDGTGTGVSFMPRPPAGIDGERCVGCHVVSPTGRYMAGRLGGGDNIGAIFDLTVDLTGDPPPTVWPISGGTTRWWFASWSPDETRLIQEELRRLQVMDPFTGALVATAGDPLPTVGATHPAWSPDGTAIAYAANANDWGGAFTSADIGIIPVTGPDTFGPAGIIHRGADLAGSPPGGVADSYPSWTPDSNWIAFGHGTGCRSEDRNGALYLMRRDGSGVVRLDRASGGPTAGDSFQPRFSPFTGGGYFWMSYLTRRDYGNAEVGTRGRALQQIWVSAIREAPGGGDDPSEVGYWLPGQSTGSRNISAYWAPRPCRPDGESCTVGSECCGGDCRPGPGGALVCSPPPPERCRREGETCTTSADCCPDMGLTCYMNVCTREPG